MLEEFEQVYSAYYDVVYRYMLSLCGRADWAEEITQETFFKALRRIDRFRGECKLNVWLCQIAKNTYLTELKRQSRRGGVPAEAEIPLEQRVGEQETAAQIHRILHEMDEPYREVFWMRVFGELSYKEIAALFGKTESWARVTYFRARQKIKEGLT